jgi:hypothetical protein
MLQRFIKDFVFVVSDTDEDYGVDDIIFFFVFDVIVFTLIPF